jgi:hypothetical protein
LYPPLSKRFAVVVGVGVSSGPMGAPYLSYLRRVALGSSLLVGACADDGDPWDAHLDLVSSLEVLELAAGENRVVKLTFHREGAFARESMMVRFSLFPDTPTEHSMSVPVPESARDEVVAAESTGKSDGDHLAGGTLMLAPCESVSCESVFSSSLISRSSSPSDVLINLYGHSTVPFGVTARDNFGLELTVEP